MEPLTWMVHRVDGVVDGDSVHLIAERNIMVSDDLRATFAPVPNMKVRLVNLDTPERGEVGWFQARKDVLVWVSEHCSSLMVDTYGRDSFGRYLGDIYTYDDRGNTLTQYMLRERGWLPWIREN